jgi:hypothetical protein
LYKKNLSIIEDDTGNDQREEEVVDIEAVVVNNNNDVDMTSSSSSEQHQQFLSQIFANTRPYSDEIIIKSILSKLINLIEIEQENVLKHSFSQPLASKKRKLDELQAVAESNSSATGGSEAELLLFSSMGSKEVKKKLLNPISEHFNWCPWLTELADRKLTLIDRDTNKAKQMNKTVCHIYAEIVNRRLGRLRKDTATISTTTTTTTTTTTRANLSSSQLLDKVKSAQSLLINCTSQYSLK